MKKVSASDLGNFVSCSRKVWLSFFEKNFLPSEVSGFAKYLIEKGNVFERECVDFLEGVVFPRDFYETVEFMKMGEKFIYQAVLEDDLRIGVVDLLRRVDGVESKFGNFCYEVIDIKSAILFSELEELDFERFEKKRWEVCKKYGLQLFHYLKLIELVQGVGCDLFLWLRDREGFCEVKVLDDVVSKFKFSKSLEEVYLEVLEGVLELNVEEEIRPFKCSSCNGCEWKEFCFSILEEEMHCSLIRGVQKRGLKDLERLGIFSIFDFYENVDSETKIKYVLTGKDSFKSFRMRKQAQSLIENKEFYLGDSLVGFDCDFLLFYDIEGEMGHEFEYLHGVWEVNCRTGEKKYVSFIDSDVRNEGRIWKEFLDYVRGVGSVGSFKIIYFADYERVAWGNLTEKYGTGVKMLDFLFSNSVDLLKEWVVDKLILPRYDYSIKTVAPYFGFVWECKENWYVNSEGERFQLDEANGGESIAWLDFWLSGDVVYREIILDYNRDDCVATEFVYNAMIERFGR